MPPKHGRGIVKSGNAGNSSKASKTAPTPASGSANEKKPLFPPGYKYPLTILTERCHDNGWERADVQTYERSDGWSFAVTLSRIDKKTSKKESVRMEPLLAYTRPSAIEARHWGAVYALYRFCNHMKLNLVLPPGPRDYWNELAVEHKASPPHLQWLYAADPFSARKELEERKARAAQTNNSTSNPGKQRHEVATGSVGIPEVKMASSIRELVENAVKKGLSMYPEAAENGDVRISDENAKNVSQRLKYLGFSSAQVQDALRFLSQPSAIASNLLASLTPLEAAIEYLVLHIPECDLPQRFLPSKNSSNPFVTSLHSGSDDLKRRWMEEKATMEAGWPENIVKECMTDIGLAHDWESLLVALGRRIIGENAEEMHNALVVPPYKIEPSELEAYGAIYVTKSELVMPLFSAPIKVHIYISAEVQTVYPRPGYIPVYLSSETVPAYIRLHLLSKLLVSAKSDAFLDKGEGFCLAVMRVLEEEWDTIETNGRPEITSVLQHLIPRPATHSTANAPDLLDTLKFTGVRKRQRSKAIDKSNSIAIREDFLTLRQKDEYLSLLSARQRLPAYKFKDVFLHKLESHSVVVVIGETGCGKTTQLPQFILDSLILSDRGSETSIIVTQPRRLAAISVANRVSAERLNDGSVGYAVRGETKVTEKTRLLFCTTGVALRRMTSGDQLRGVSHVVMDEVHERGVDSDLLLLGLKQILEKNHSLRVVLMSATINHEKLSEYFNSAPVLEIPGFSHPVTDFYLEDIEPMLSAQDGSMKNRTEILNQEGLLSNKSEPRRRSRNRMDYQLIAATIRYIIASAEKRGGILIFLSGVQEIRQCTHAISNVINNKEGEILPLHANLTSDEQSRVFRHTSKWKIIVATNVAETSITVDDVIYVIDTGKVKEMKYDSELHLSTLAERWISRAAGRQRRGRAGRTQPGTCYKLYTRQEECNMEDFSVPEIHRIPLENVILYAKTIHQGENTRAFLGCAIDPPKDAAFDTAWNNLMDLGAVEPSGQMTALGRYIAELPADVKLAKMLILGTIFQCLDPILTIVACLSSKPLFVIPMDKRNEANLARRRFSTAGSDLLTDMKAYDECMSLQTQGDHARTIHMFCEENFISLSSMQSVTSLRCDFFSYLTDLGFIPHHLKPSSEMLNGNSDNVNLIKSVILGGLWPQTARVRVRVGAQKFDQVQAGTVAREINARDYVLHDMKVSRVFLHPGSVLFDTTSWKCDFVTYFHKYQSDKVYLRDATQVPLYSLLLLGGRVTVNHVVGGLNIVSSDDAIKLKAWPRIGILVNQLRRLLDAQLTKCFEAATVLSNMSDGDIVDAFKILITNDGMSDGN